jgi:hypothetical protein
LAGVVPTLDIGEQRRARLGLGVEAAAVEQFAFDAGEEALGHRVVVRPAHAAHRGAHAHLLAALAKLQARGLADLVEVMDDAVCLALRERHVQRRQHPIGMQRLADAPAHHAAAPDLQHDDQVDEPGPRGT